MSHKSNKLIHQVPCMNIVIHIQDNIIITANNKMNILN